MRVSEVMTTEPSCCTPETTAQEAARLMSEQDCGCLPVVDANDRLVGVVTDRDIACRCVAEGKEPSTPVADIMTSGARCCSPDDDVSEATRIMTEAQVRRVPVIDGQGCCVGIVAQADIARAATSAMKDDVADVVEHVSEPTASASQPDQTSAGRAVR